MGWNMNIVHNVSVAGCLGYDVLVGSAAIAGDTEYVSVAGCLGYDVLVKVSSIFLAVCLFQLLVV